jgi:cobalt-zinc-cadmium efflux system outer membrane protein
LRIIFSGGMRFHFALKVAPWLIPASLAAQTPLTRSSAIDAALDRGARLGVAQADTAIANAALITARALPNPSVNASYSKSFPTWHFSADIPIDFPMLRDLRVRAAQTGLLAAQLRLQFNRAMIAMEADTAYTRAVAARQKLALSRRTALDADSLLHMVERRRDAGDASDMDVELARVSAGQQTNLAADDSLTYISTLLDLQGALGLLEDSVAIRPTDSLTTPPGAPAQAATSLDVESARLSVDAASDNARLQHRSIWSQLSISPGFETGDPDQKGFLPTLGIGVGLPLFDRNRGQIAQAEAERLRAQAELRLAEVEARNALAHALRERENAIGKVARDQALVTSADRVAAMALTAYREGASSLPNVLEAQRTAREVLSQYIDDLAAAWVATAELRVFSYTRTSTPP